MCITHFVYLFIVIDTWVVATFLAMNMAVQISVKSLHSILFDIYLSSGIAGSYGSPVFNHCKATQLFFTADVPFYIPIINAHGSNFSTSLPTLVICWVFVILATLVVMKWYFILLLLFIFLMTTDIEHFSCAFWLFVYLYWTNVIVRTLPIFYTGQMSF